MIDSEKINTIVDMVVIPVSCIYLAFFIGFKTLPESPFDEWWAVPVFFTLFLSVGLSPFYRKFITDLFSS